MAVVIERGDEGGDATVAPTSSPIVERVPTGLASLRDFDGDGGHAFLAVAHRCL